MTASITLRRRVQWIDTDAAQVWHHSVVTRWAEEAETELHRQLGIIDQTFGATPRVRTEFDFGRPLRFDDEVEINFSVAVVGTTSVTYQVDVTHGTDMAASGRIVTVFVDRESGEKQPWTDSIRAAFSG